MRVMVVAADAAARTVVVARVRGFAAAALSLGVLAFDALIFGVLAFAAADLVAAGFAAAAFDVAAFVAFVAAGFAAFARVVAFPAVFEFFGALAIRPSCCVCGQAYPKSGLRRAFWT
ncbi:MAG: hypothetical protein AAF674_22720 [Pseudomonadota bacterium]